MFYLLTCLQIGAVSIFRGTTVVAFPFEGEGGASATDEGGWTALTFLPFHRNSDAVSKRKGITVAAFPRVGKVSRQRRMRACVRR